MAKTKKLTAREYLYKTKWLIFSSFTGKALLTEDDAIKLLNGFASQFKPKPTRRKKEDLRPGKGINPGFPDGPEGDGKQNQNNRG